MENILARRSIRKYKPDVAVEDCKIKKILEAAMSAPSAGNQQPWHYIVIEDKEILDQIPEFHPYADMIKQVNVAILVCGDTSKEKHKGFWVQDCSAATQNILIAAHALGLGSVWLGVYPREERVEKLQKMLGLPEHVIPFSLLPIGYADIELPPANRYTSKRVRYNHW